MRVNEWVFVFVVGVVLLLDTLLMNAINLSNECTSLKTILLNDKSE